MDTSCFCRTAILRVHSLLDGFCFPQYRDVSILYASGVDAVSLVRMVRLRVFPAPHCGLGVRSEQLAHTIYDNQPLRDCFSATTSCQLTYI